MSYSDKAQIEHPPGEPERRRQQASVAVYFDDGSLEAKANYVPHAAHVAELVAAAKVLNYLGDQYHAEGRPRATDEGGEGGIVQIGNVELEVGPKDIMVCVALDEFLRPVHDVTMGAPPHPVHLWTGAMLLEQIARFTVNQNLIANAAEAAAQHNLRQQIAMGGAQDPSRLPEHLRRRLN